MHRCLYIAADAREGAAHEKRAAPVVPVRFGLERIVIRDLVVAVASTVAPPIKKSIGTRHDGAAFSGWAICNLAPY